MKSCTKMLNRVQRHLDLIMMHGTAISIITSATGGLSLKTSGFMSICQCWDGLKRRGTMMVQRQQQMICIGVTLQTNTRQLQVKYVTLEKYGMQSQYRNGSVDTLGH